MSKLLKYARYENERRFLLARLPADLPAHETHDLADLYLDGTRLRLRLARGPDGEVVERKLNQKILDPGGDPARRVITSVYLDAAEYERLAVLPGRRLEKRRHTYLAAGCQCGVDAFAGPLAGLVLAEIESEDLAALRALPLPAFAHCEVTEHEAFTGGRLAHEPERALAEARRLLAR